MRIKLVFLAYLAIPFVVLIRLWRNDSPNLGKWLFEVTVAGILISYIYLIGVWPMAWGHYARYILAGLFFFVTFQSFKNIPREFCFERHDLKQSLSFFINGFAVCFFAWQVFLALKGFICPLSSVDLEFPLKDGQFYIVHGGSTRVINHHVPHPEQGYALDIVQINPYGFRANQLIPKRLEDFHIFGATVYSPCSGTVIEVMNQYPDLDCATRDPEHPKGNYVAIANNGSESTIILAHLMKNSLLVKVGESVQTGQPLARVGNSGNTTEPHLHIHAIARPITFRGRFLTRNDVVSN